MVPDREQLRGLHQAFFGEDPLILRCFCGVRLETLFLPKSLQAKAKCALQDI
jgi:hypothetical protein